jgi:acetylornithine deacetylase/succinyl-diaminopimelate desuccinylase-like protein
VLRLGNTVSDHHQHRHQGERHPRRGLATLDCRLLPDIDPDAFLAELAKVVSDARVTVEVLNRFEGAESTMDHEFVRVVSDVVAEMVEGARVIPEMTSGFTDSRIYRVRASRLTGSCPASSGARSWRGAQPRERLSVENLRWGCGSRSGAAAGE